ncbi:bifunctional DedA family/phosphatase PAP2 family protein [Marinobacterium arenosum]|uniref:bifunctional DedA family/phosphatase PAP2 family protein n=1 Tax=Marinobacterium arenosum TaxID=2862496 RepID=UPI001C95951F|nr:bifunctional DedA family/phosphatase PAP2 family protein [Marinobacterium arenosum]MBY4675684.1 bifunctional DedA family/phosphatase PAP2 family protein [Marinobacterium arenosum]
MIAALIDWFYSPQGLPLLIGLVALLESLLLVGLLVPGVALIASLSWLAGQQQLALPVLLGWGFVGAVLGDGISYWLGRHWAGSIASLALFRRHPRWLADGHRFFARYGGLSVLVGRFVGPVRPFIPFIAGSMAMPPLRFMLVNILSALLWAPAYLLPGYWLGEQSQQLQPYWNGPLQLLGALLLLMLLWHSLHLQLQPQRWLARQLGWLPEPRGSWLLLATALTLLTLLCLIRLLVGVPDSEQLWHQQLQQWPHWLKPAAVAITQLGDKVLLLGLSFGLVALLAWRGLWRHGLVFISLLFALVAFNSGLKWLYALPRPPLGTSLYDSWSFPSGHASAAAGFFAMLAVLLVRGWPDRLRRRLYTLTLLPVTLVPLSRVLLDLHWPLDALAGALEGIVAALCWRLWLDHRPLPLDSRLRRQIGCGVAVGTGLYLLACTSGALQFYQLSG